MKTWILCILTTLILTYSWSNADVYPEGFDFDDSTIKSWSDYANVYGSCGDVTKALPGDVCASAIAASTGLALIDEICTDFDQDGVCIASESRDGLYADTSVSSPLAVSCERGSVTPPVEPSCVVEGGTSALKRRSTTTCGEWGRCSCFNNVPYVSQGRTCCTTTTWSGLGLSLTTCARELRACENRNPLRPEPPCPLIE